MNCSLCSGNNLIEPKKEVLEREDSRVTNAVQKVPFFKVPCVYSPKKM